MQEIEHALHTSAKTGGNEGYQVVAKSAGISTADARELATWCPSHGSLLPDAAPSGGISAFRLSNGSPFVAKTLVAGSEYSDRGGPRLVTHCLKPPHDLILRFANNPFALLNAVVAGGHLDRMHDRNRPLESFPLVGRAKAFDQALIRDAQRRLGQNPLIKLLRACCAKKNVGITGGQESVTWMAAVVNLLPVATRPDATFTAGLRPTACRPVRLASVDGDDVQLCRRLKRNGVCIVDCRPVGSRTGSTDDGQESVGSEQVGWAAFVANCLARQRIDELEAAIECDDAPNTLEELDEFAMELLRSDACRASGGERAVPTTASGRTVTSSEEDLPPSHNAPLPETLAPVAMQLDATVVLERLELLDDTIFAAINGDPASLAEAASRWRDVASARGTEMVEESREQYLRHAITVWQSSRSDDRIGPDQAAAALEIIALLTERGR